MDKDSQVSGRAFIFLVLQKTAVLQSQHFEGKRKSYAKYNEIRVSAERY